MRRAIIGTALLLLAGGAREATAYHPRPEDMDSIQRVTRELEVATRRLSERAEAASHHYSAREDSALRKLDELSARSTQLRRQVVAYRANPESTTDAFEALAAAWVRVSASLNDLHAEGDVLADFRHVERLMADLTDYYGGQENFWGVNRPERGRRFGLAAGTPITVELSHAVRSRDFVAGDDLTARLADDLMVNGRLLAPRGSIARLQVVERKRAGRSSGKERLALTLTQLEVGGRRHAVESETVTFVADDGHGKDAKIVGGASALGAIIGAISDSGEGALKGALVGAAAGTGAVLVTRGKAINLPAGQRITFRLEAALRIPVREPGAPQILQPTRDDDISHRR